MSLINQVLQDLEARRGEEGRSLPNEVRALPRARRRSPWPWVTVVLILAAVAAVWLWRPAAPVPAAPVAAVVAEQEPPVRADKPAPGKITVPVAAVIKPSVAPAPAVKVPTPADAVLHAAARSALPLVAVAPARTPPESPGPTTQIDKEVRPATARERAAVDYNRGLALLNQGRIEQALSALRAALDQDPGWAAPRQALVGTLLEQRRFAEAEAVLRDALARDPAQTEAAMQLARLQVERKDLPGAAATLQSAAPAAAGNAEFFGLQAAVLQRQGRHREATAAYQAALTLVPQSGVWWMGLGLSLEAEGRTTDAREAFRRARDTGSLSADLTSFVEQKLK